MVEYDGPAMDPDLRLDLEAAYDTFRQLGPIIREERRRRKQTLKQAAEEIGVHWTHLSHVERGERALSSTTISKALAWLLGLESY